MSLALPATTWAPGVVRDHVTEFASTLPEETLDDVRLLLTELVTNAVKYADLTRDEVITVQLDSHPDSVEATIRYPRHNVFDMRAIDETAGLGLLIVDKLADHWSIGQRNDVLEAWFEIQTAK